MAIDLNTGVFVHPDIERILFNKQVILGKSQSLGRQISRDYHGKELTVVYLLEGSLIFAANLIIEMTIDIDLVSLKVSSYQGKESTGLVVYNSQDLSFCHGKNILLVDDILDSGLTMSTLKRAMENNGAKEVKTCVMLNKKVKRSIEIEADYKAFDIENEFIVGYGLDYNGLYRNLPYIGVLRDK